MVNCFLCYSEGRRSRFVNFCEILSSFRTVADVVREHFPSVPHDLREDPAVCMNCYTKLKGFSELCDIVEKNHSYPKISLVKCEAFNFKSEPEECDTVSVSQFLSSNCIEGIEVAEDEFKIFMKDEDDDDPEYNPDPRPKNRKKHQSRATPAKSLPPIELTECIEGIEVAENEFKIMVQDTDDDDVDPEYNPDPRPKNRKKYQPRAKQSKPLPLTKGTECIEVIEVAENEFKIMVQDTDSDPDYNPDPRPKIHKKHQPRTEPAKSLPPIGGTECIQGIEVFADEFKIKIRDEPRLKIREDYNPAKGRLLLIEMRQKTMQHLPELLNDKSYFENHSPVQPISSDDVKKFISENIDIRCYVCETKCQTMTELLKHFRKTHPQSIASFSCCGMTIKTPYHFTDHVKANHIKGVALHGCVECPLAFRTNYLLYLHNFQDHPKVPCETCGEKVGNEYALIAHKELHRHDDSQFECFKCGHESSGYFNSKRHLEEHPVSIKTKVLKRRKWYKKPEYWCDRCDFFCTHKVSLRTHMSTHAEQDLIARGEGISCPKCQKVFGSRQSLDRHQATQHKSNRAILCEICSKYVRYSGHMKTHQQEERVKCPHCSRFLKNATSLSAHIRKYHRQDPNKKHQCAECGKIYKSAESLAGHVSACHKLKRILPCRFCPKLMKRAKDVQEHEATHTGIDLYFCEWCPKSFKFGASYRGHRKREHAGEYIPRSESKSFVPEK